jgi:hypothetical protein
VAAVEKGFWRYNLWRMDAVGAVIVGGVDVFRRLLTKGIAERGWNTRIWISAGMGEWGEGKKGALLKLLRRKVVEK